MTTTTDTPRTNAAKWYWDSAERENCVSIVLARKLERELKNAQEAYLKSVERDDYLTQELAASQAEVERLKEQLESTQNLCLKFWSVLEEHGFELEINQ
jgi:hypothetical protein